MDKHKPAVDRISKQVQALHGKRRPFRIDHGSTCSLHPPNRSGAFVQTSGLNNILEISTDLKYAVVEPNVSMDQLVKETLKHGLMPAVTPAFPGMTVGGAVSGIASGSSSFRYGFFDQAVMSMEVVLHDGTITTTNRQLNPELLIIMAGTLGTIGIGTLYQINLVPAARYVELSYIAVGSREEAVETITQCSLDRNNDFVEGLIYGAAQSAYGIVVVGKLSKDKTHSISKFSRAQDPWFYMHALEARGKTESVPIRDYLFRYDRGCFCIGRLCFASILPLNKWTQWMMDPAMSSRSLIKTVQSLQWADHLIMQDLALPLNEANGLLDYIEKNLGSYPLHLCPVGRRTEFRQVMRPNPRKADMFMGIGIRGYTEQTINNAAQFAQAHIGLHHQVFEAGGFHGLHSRSYDAQELFWGVYHKDDYDRMRGKFKAENLESIFGKIQSQRSNVAPSKPHGLWNRMFARTSLVAVRNKQPQTQTQIGNTP